MSGYIYGLSRRPVDAALKNNDRYQASYTHDKHHEYYSLRNFAALNYVRRRVIYTSDAIADWFLAALRISSTGEF